MDDLRRTQGQQGSSLIRQRVEVRTVVRGNFDYRLSIPGKLLFPLLAGNIAIALSCPVPVSRAAFRHS